MTTMSNANINNSPANLSVASNTKGVGKTDNLIDNIYFTDETEKTVSVYGKTYNVAHWAGNVQLLKILGDNAKSLPLDKLHNLAAAVTAGYVSLIHQQNTKDTDKPAIARKPTLPTVQTPLEIAKQAIIADLQSYIELLNTSDELIASLVKDGYFDLTITRIVDLSEARKADSILRNKEHIERAIALFNSLDDTTGVITPTPDESITLGNSKTITVFEPSIDIDGGKLTIIIYGASSADAAKLLAARATANGFSCKTTGGKGLATISYSIV